MSKSIRWWGEGNPGNESDVHSGPPSGMVRNHPLGTPGCGIGGLDGHWPVEVNVHHRLLPDNDFRRGRTGWQSLHTCRFHSLVDGSRLVIPAWSPSLGNRMRCSPRRSGRWRCHGVAPQHAAARRGPRGIPRCHFGNHRRTAGTGIPTGPLGAAARSHRRDPGSASHTQHEWKHAGGTSPAQDPGRFGQ